MSDNNKPISNANLKNLKHIHNRVYKQTCASAVIDHARSKNHISAVEIKAAKSRTSKEIRQTEAGKASMWLQKSAVVKLVYLFRITHAVVRMIGPCQIMIGCACSIKIIRSDTRFQLVWLNVRQEFQEFLQVCHTIHYRNIKAHGYW